MLLPLLKSPPRLVYRARWPCSAEAAAVVDDSGHADPQTSYVTQKVVVEYL